MRKNCKRILIPGGAGSIGSELVRQLSKDHKIYILDINESGIFDLTDELKDRWVKGRVGDIRDYATVKDVFDDFKPQYVFNCAALKHVPLMEYTPLEAIQTNVIGHYNLVHVAKTYECLEKFVFISTDKSVNANSIMGISKRMGEVITVNSGKQFIVVRFGNVMDSRGSLLKIWQRQIDTGKKLTVTNEKMERFMMTIPEACSLVINACKIGKDGDILVMNMGKRVNIKQLALEILNKAGIKKELDFIGLRPGETMSEELMSEEEKKRSQDMGTFWVIKKNYANRNI